MFSLKMMSTWVYKKVDAFFKSLVSENLSKYLITYIVINGLAKVSVNKV